MRHVAFIPPPLRWECPPRLRGFLRVRPMPTVFFGSSLGPELVFADHSTGLNPVVVVELPTSTFLCRSMFLLCPPRLKRFLRLETDDVDLVAVFPRVPFDRDEAGDGFDELVHSPRCLRVLFLVSAFAQVRLEEHDDFRGILYTSIGQPPPPPSRSLLGAVRCRGSKTFSASSGVKRPISITSCLTVFPVRPASFAISAAFS